MCCSMNTIVKEGLLDINLMWLTKGVFSAEKARSQQIQG